VRRVQQRLQPPDRAGLTACLTSREVAELEARAQRLRAMGDRFIHVGVSHYVAQGTAMEVLDRVGGECVAKEV
jgi:hypothetical protein